MVLSRICAIYVIDGRGGLNDMGEAYQRVKGNYLLNKTLRILHFRRKKNKKKKVVVGS